MEKLEVYIAFFLALLSTAAALECYACEKQDNNRNKCVKTKKQCEEYQDACTAYVQWKVPPYWTPRGDRIYQIYKDCDTRRGCAARTASTNTMCKRDWYNDWACVECCTGDLCNYYVTMAAGSVRANMLVTATVAVALALLRRVW